MSANVTTYAFKEVKSHETLSYDINQQIDFFKEKAREFLILNFATSQVSPAVLANKFLASPDKVRSEALQLGLKNRL